MKETDKYLRRLRGKIERRILLNDWTIASNDENWIRVGRHRWCSYRNWLNEFQHWNRWTLITLANQIDLNRISLRLWMSSHCESDLALKQNILATVADVGNSITSFVVNQYSSQAHPLSVSHFPCAALARFLSPLPGNFPQHLCN